MYVCYMLFNKYAKFRRRSSQPITRLILTNKTVQENTNITQYKSKKVNYLKYSKTKLPWFSCLLQHSDRKRGGLILQRFRAHTGQTRQQDYQWRPYRWCKWCGAGAPGPTTLGAHQRGPDSNFFEKLTLSTRQNPVQMTSFIKVQRHLLLRTLMTSLIASRHSCCHSVHCLRTI